MRANGNDTAEAGQYRWKVFTMEESLRRWAYRREALRSATSRAATLTLDVSVSS
jgi:hypothetical protein